MIRYGAMKKVDIDMVELNRLFRKAKKGFVKIEQFAMDYFFTVSGYYGYDDSKSYEEAEAAIKRILEAINEKDYGNAQLYIDTFTESIYNRTPQRLKKELNRNLVTK